MAGDGSFMDDPETARAVAVRLEKTRLGLGYPRQVDFCKAAGGGITPQGWNNYETGRHRLALNAALTLCRRFNLTLDWLYRGDDSGLPRRLIEAMAALREEGTEPPPPPPKPPATLRRR